MEAMLEFFDCAFHPYKPLQAQLEGWATTVRAWARGLPAFLNIPTGNGKTEVGVVIGAHAERAAGAETVVYATPTKLQQQDTVKKLRRAHGDETTRVAVLYGRNEYLCASPESEVVQLRAKPEACGALYEPLSDEAVEAVRACLRARLPDLTLRAAAALSGPAADELGEFLERRAALRGALARWRPALRRRASAPSNAAVGDWRRAAVLAHLLWRLKQFARPSGTVDAALHTGKLGGRYGFAPDPGLTADLQRVLDRWLVRTRYVPCPGRMPQEEFAQLHRLAVAERWAPQVRTLRTALERAGVREDDAARAATRAARCACGNPTHCGVKAARGRVVTACHVVMSQKLLLCLQDHDSGLGRTLYDDRPGDDPPPHLNALVDDESHAWPQTIYDHLAESVKPLTVACLERNHLWRDLRDHGVLPDLRATVVIPTPKQDELATDTEWGRVMVRQLTAYLESVPNCAGRVQDSMLAAIDNPQCAKAAQLAPAHWTVVRYVTRAAHAECPYKLAARVCRAVNRLRRYLRRFVGAAPSAIVLGRASRAELRRKRAAEARLEQLGAEPEGEDADADADADGTEQLPDADDMGVVRWFPTHAETQERLREHWGTFEHCACMSGTLVDVDDGGARDMETFLRFSGWELSEAEQRACVCAPPSVQDFTRMDIYIGRARKGSRDVQRFMGEDEWPYVVAADREAIAMAAARGSGLVMSTARKRGREQFELSERHADEGVTHYWYERDPTTTEFRAAHGAARTAVYHGSKGVMTGTDVPDLAFVALLNQPWLPLSGLFHACVARYYEQNESRELVTLRKALYCREMRVLLRQAIGRLMRGPDAAGGVVLLLDLRLRDQERMLRCVFPGCRVRPLKDLFE